MRFFGFLLRVSAVVAGVQARPFTVVADNVENLFDLDGVANYDDDPLGNYPRAHALTTRPNIARVVTTVALTAAALPRVASLCTESLNGEIVTVDGVVAQGARLAVEFLGETYDVFSHDADFRKKLRVDFQAEPPRRFYGERGHSKERWQFVNHGSR